MSILAIDAGTTGVTALVVADDARVLARGYEEFPQHFPRPGWVEHEPEQIWQAALSACRQAVQASDSRPTAIGITDQRETAVLWDRSSLAAPRRAVVWQDRRSAAICDRLRDAGHEDRLRELTGLRFDPYFTGTKLRWLAENDAKAWAGVADGSVALGTVDSLDTLISTNSPALGHASSNLVVFTEGLKEFSTGLGAILATNSDQIHNAVKNIESSTTVLKTVLEELQAGKGLAGALLKNEQLADSVSQIANNLSITSSNLNRLGLWGILWQRKPPKANAPSEPARPLAAPKQSDE